MHSRVICILASTSYSRVVLLLEYELSARTARYSDSARPGLSGNTTSSTSS